MIRNRMRLPVIGLLAMLAFLQVGAQEKKPTLWKRITSNKYLTRIDSVLSARYFRMGKMDTAYITRPQTKWTVVARVNVSGAKINAEGLENGHPFKAEMKANYKSTLSLGLSYLGLSLSASINPAKLAGKYSDYELNVSSYGNRFGFDLIYQKAQNFTGWHEREGEERIKLPADLLTLKTLNINAYYAFNSRRFSYSAAFSQNYIQRHSAGSFLLAISGQGQKGTTNGEKQMKLKMTNIGIGAGYGYNFVPGRGWMLHISALPTFIVYSNTAMSFGDTEVPLHYHFPEVIITGRGAVVRQTRKTFYGASAVFNFTNIGDKENLAVHNIKWYVRTFFGLRF